MTLDEFIAKVQELATELDPASIRLLVDAADDVVVLAQETGHEQTGHMIETMHRLGPFPVNATTVEARIESAAPYAALEAARGGLHDWPTLTAKAAEPRLQQLADAVADSVVRALTERS